MAFLLNNAHDQRAHRLDEPPRGPAPRGARTNTGEGRPPPLETNVVDGFSDASVSPSPKRKNVVIADPVAFRYLEEDSSVTVIERRTVLPGYESYLVEQWACSRQSPTLGVVTYTGDQQHTVVVGVLSVPADEGQWPVKLRVYFKAIQKFYARPKETILGELMVTNLSSFPSALTVILVPGGDIRKHRQTFIINEDLKRLGCSGRSGLTLAEPAEATQLKFQQLYKTHERVPFAQAVTELIKMCQAALYIFQKLDHEYIDGLLCDKTETAINNWWVEVGAEHYNFEPTDGILGPSTVAALLGMLMGAKNRLHWYGAPVVKDVFDLENTKRGIGHFQKSQKLEKTRRLDRPTMLKLYNVTAKAATGEGWGVQKAVKSTVTEIGGKRGELVMGIVSGKDKGGLADIETLDFDKFVSLVHGERAKWLWHGKSRKAPVEHPTRTPELNSNGLVWKEDDPMPAAKRITSLPTEEELEVKRNEESNAAIYSELPPGSATSLGENQGDKDMRKNVFKSVAGKMSDARSGFGRIKDAVGGGLRGHNARPSISTREDCSDAPFVTPTSGLNTGLAPGPMTAPAAGIGRAFTWNKKPEEYLAAIKRGDMDIIDKSPFASTSTVDIRPFPTPGEELQKRSEAEGDATDAVAEGQKNIMSTAPSAVGSVADVDEAPASTLDTERKTAAFQSGHVRRHSIALMSSAGKKTINENRWPRRMSFGDVADAVLGWQQLVDIGESVADPMALEALSELARHFNQDTNSIRKDLEPWVTEKINGVEWLNDRYAEDKAEIQALFQQLNEACQRVRVSSDELLGEERAHLTESLKEVEVLVARLDYEINALRSKVSDVEDGIMTFERQVEDMEERAAKLKAQLETEGWMHWIFRTVTGIGTGPDITRTVL